MDQDNRAVYSTYKTLAFSRMSKLLFSIQWKRLVLSSKTFTEYKPNPNPNPDTNTNPNTNPNPNLTLTPTLTLTLTLILTLN